MSDSKRQSLIMTGIALLLLSGLLLYFSLSQPKVSKEETTAFSSASSTEYQVKVSVRDGVAYPVNLNTCSVEELMNIDGIGESRASAIIEYRNYIGGYTSVDQIKNIKGIGDALYEKVAPYLCV